MKENGSENQGSGGGERMRGDHKQRWEYSVYCCTLQRIGQPKIE